MLVSEPSEFFNNICGSLKIDLSKPAQRVGELLNEYADADAQIVGMRLEPEVYVEESDELRELTNAEFELTAYAGPAIALRGESGKIVRHSAPNGKHFTVRDLLQAVEETERQTRGDTEWLGGVDIQHCFFEGVHADEEEDGVFQIYWGS